MYRLCAIIITLLGRSQAQLYWNDPIISDLNVTKPTPIIVPTQFITALLGFGQGFKLHVPMITESLRRWQYQLVTNTPAETEGDLDTLKPLVIFPDFQQFADTGSEGTVYLFGSTTKYYDASCSLYGSFSNYSCIVSASAGSAASGFGTGNPVQTTIIWANSYAFVEYHPFLEGRHVFSVNSLFPTLDVTTKNSILEFVSGLGFNTSNVVYQVY